MKSILFALLICLIAGLGLNACNHDDQGSFTGVYEVPEELQHIVDTFIYEAGIRGHELAITNLIIRFDDGIDETVCGDCNSLSDDEQKIIRIKTMPFACYFTNEQLEALVIHEMGHCVLGREHNDEQLPNGDPKSIMTTSDIGIYSSCLYDLGGNEDCNFTHKRTYYMNELFDESTPAPDWALAEE
jgi:hypothetical protein